MDGEEIEKGRDFLFISVQDHRCLADLYAALGYRIAGMMARSL